LRNAKLGDIKLLYSLRGETVSMADRQINYQKEIEAIDRGIKKLKSRIEKLEYQKKYLEVLKMDRGQK